MKVPIGQVDVAFLCVCLHDDRSPSPLYLLPDRAVRLSITTSPIHLPALWYAVFVAGPMLLVQVGLSATVRRTSNDIAFEGGVIIIV